MDVDYFANIQIQVYAEIWIFIEFLTTHHACIRSKGAEKNGY